MNVLVVEYPGYGVYHAKEPTQAQVEQDAEAVFIYMLMELRVPDSQIIIFGRSLGTGPACFLSTIY